jgi:hypothetical protein
LPAIGFGNVDLDLPRRRFPIGFTVEPSVQIGHPHEKTGPSLIASPRAKRQPHIGPVPHMTAGSFQVQQNLYKKCTKQNKMHVNLYKIRRFDNCEKAQPCRADSSLRQSRCQPAPSTEHPAATSQARTKEAHRKVAQK